jgi:hypothetical protein
MGHIGDKKEGVGGGGKVFAQAGFEGGPKVFDGVEAGRVGRQKQQLATGGFHQLMCRRRLMKPRIIQHDDAARRQFRQENLFYHNDALPGGGGGLILFYNEKAFAGLASDGKEFTLYRDAARVTREPNSFGGHFFLKIINQQDRCTFLASADGKTWTSLLADVDFSGLQHNKFGGFLALRPGLMAAGSGEVKFDRFVYKKP